MFAHIAGFGRRVGRLVKQRYMLSVMCGRSIYKLTLERRRSKPCDLSQHFSCAAEWLRTESFFVAGVKSDISRPD
jgi:hypothetical protein